MRRRKRQPIIHYIWLSHYGKKKLPHESLNSSLNSFARINHNHNHKVWTGEDIEELLDMPQLRVYCDDYNNIDYIPLKMTIAKFLILYAEGGICTDINVSGIRELHSGSEEVTIFCDEDDVISLKIIAMDRKLDLSLLYLDALCKEIQSGRRTLSSKERVAIFSNCLDDSYHIVYRRMCRYVSFVDMPIIRHDIIGMNSIIPNMGEPELLRREAISVVELYIISLVVFIVMIVIVAKCKYV